MLSVGRGLFGHSIEPGAVRPGVRGELPSRRQSVFIETAGAPCILERYFIDVDDAIAGRGFLVSRSYRGLCFLKLSVGDRPKSRNKKLRSYAAPA